MNRDILILFLGMSFQLLPVLVLADTEVQSIPAQEQVIQPQLERRDVKVPHIGANDFELGYYSGILSMENFSAESVKGVRLAYHVTEDFFLEGAYARSTISDEFFRSRAFPITGENSEETRR